MATDGHRLALVQATREGDGPAEESPGHPAEEDGHRTGPPAARRRGRHPVRAAGEPPVLHGRRPRADLADDRRAVPGLRARGAEGQRQVGRVRARAAGERAQARRAAVARAVARGEVLDRGGQGRSVVEQPRARRGEGDDPRRRLRGRPDLRLVSTVSTCSSSSTWSGTDKVALELKDEVSQAVMKPVGAGRLRLHLRADADEVLSSDSVESQCPIT